VSDANDRIQIDLDACALRGNERCDRRLESIHSATLTGLPSAGGSTQLLLIGTDEYA
jgi:hypothetical protein